jgi:hypothetical protein
MWSQLGTRIILDGSFGVELRKLYAFAWLIYVGINICVVFFSQESKNWRQCSIFFWD